MSLTRVKSPGWAAFDLKQRQKQGLAPETDKDSYPPISSTLTSLRNCENVSRNTDVLVKPFSSVLRPSVEFPTLTEENECDYKGKHGHKAIEQHSRDLALKKLKALHSWADNSLIEDLMEAVDNDIKRASNLLEGMVSSSGSAEENKETKIAESSSTIDESPCYRKGGEICFLEKALDLSNLSTTTGDGVNDNFIESVDVRASSVINVSDKDDGMKSIMERLSSLPIEPEWEEDDVYLVHRKDAMKMMRSASQHSKAANNAYLRGDHFSAQQHSLKARKEWLIAERLNSKAAKEILGIRNSENDMWKLDLHGLHAAEAVQALQERLQKIEMQRPMNCSVSPKKVKSKNGMVCTASLESFGCMDMEVVDKQRSSLRQIQKSLQVITGIGNHSRGQAALPKAVKNFLSESR
ncbi:Smr domain-containing protein [Citrus sinensis]|nr:hypothetical protein CICLE_v10025459mg [Citrus x clementina]ESR39620.1 hypothetical protein CICLE_v10025459mg [Citrus x clementina]KAH9664588.1 Smr domain-containing protein [Citrus sinensis]